MIYLLTSLVGINAQIPDLVPYLKGGYYGYSDPQGHILIQPRFRRAVFFKGQHAQVEIKEKDTVKEVIINKRGEIVFNNPGDRNLELLPCGKYFTITIHGRNDSADHVNLYSVKGTWLKEFEGLNAGVEYVMDSVVFYYTNKGTDESGPFQYNAYDLTKKRTVPQDDKFHHYIYLNDSLLLAPQKEVYRLVRLRNHIFQYDEKFSGFVITDHRYAGNFLVIRNSRNQYGIASREGRIVIEPRYKKIMMDGYVQQWNFYDYSPDGHYTRFDCAGFDENEQYDRFLVSGNQLKKTLNPVAVAHNDYGLHNSYVMTELKSAGSQRQGLYRLYDSSGKVVVDSFRGSHCGLGIYLMKGNNGYSAFWYSGKFISPFIYNDYIWRYDSYILPPPINHVIDNCIITVVYNQGNNAFGLMDVSGKILLPPIFHYIRPAGNGLYFVSGDKGMFYCSSGGQVYASDIGLGK